MPGRAARCRPLYSMGEIQAVVEILKALGIASLFGPLIGLILSIWILKKTVFAGWGELARQVVTGFFVQEKERIQVQTEVSATLQEIARQLESLTWKVSKEIKEITDRVGKEIGDNTDRLRSLEVAMSNYLDEFRDLNYNFEKHRKGIPDTEVFLQERKK
jgi:hypothetical protein